MNFLVDKTASLDPYNRGEPYAAAAAEEEEYRAVSRREDIHRSQSQEVQQVLSELGLYLSSQRAFSFERMQQIQALLQKNQQELVRSMAAEEEKVGKLFDAVKGKLIKEAIADNSLNYLYLPIQKIIGNISEKSEALLFELQYEKLLEGLHVFTKKLDDHLLKDSLAKEIGCLINKYLPSFYATSRQSQYLGEESFGKILDAAVLIKNKILENPGKSKYKENLLRFFDRIIPESSIPINSLPKAMFFEICKYTLALNDAKALFPFNLEQRDQIIADWINTKKIPLSDLYSSVQDRELLRIARKLTYVDLRGKSNSKSKNGLLVDGNKVLMNEMEIHDFLKQCINMEYLFISADVIVSLPDIVKQLKWLCCDKAFRLETLPERMDLLRKLEVDSRKLKRLPILPALRRLTLNTAVNVTDLGSLNQIDALEELAIVNNLRLVILPPLPSLKRLELIGAGNLAKISDGFNSLEELTLQGCHELGALPHFSALKKLLIFKCRKLTDEYMADFQERNPAVAIITMEEEIS